MTVVITAFIRCKDMYSLVILFRFRHCVRSALNWLFSWTAVSLKCQHITDPFQTVKTLSAHTSIHKFYESQLVHYLQLTYQRVRSILFLKTGNLFVISIRSLGAGNRNGRIKTRIANRLLVCFLTSIYDIARLSSKWKYNARESIRRNALGTYFWL